MKKANGRKAFRRSATVWQSQLSKKQSSRFSAQKCMPNSFGVFLLLLLLPYEFSEMLSVLSWQIGCTGRMRNCQKQNGFRSFFAFVAVASRMEKSIFRFFFQFFAFPWSTTSEPSNEGRQIDCHHIELIGVIHIGLNLERSTKIRKNTSFLQTNGNGHLKFAQSKNFHSFMLNLMRRKEIMCNVHRSFASNSYPSTFTRHVSRVCV